MTTDGGGWTVIQRRSDGSENFQRKWKEYEYGFGKPVGEYWLGNKDIHLLTSQARYKLRIDFVDTNGNKRYAVYNTFRVGDAASKYKLTVSGYTGNAGDQFSYHNGYKFTTIDQDNDVWGKNCASVYGGGWWFAACYYSFLNAPFKGKMYWRSTLVKTATMMIKKY